MRIFSTRKQLVAAMPRQAVVAEIGVLRGDFSRSILRKAKPRRLHLIDCWEEYHSGLEFPHDGSPGTQNDHEDNFSLVKNRFASQIAAGCVELHRGYSVPVLKTFPDASFDWIYIDANHSYDAVSSELITVRSKMKPGGVIAGHDYINTPHWKNHNFGVVEAVDEFCAKYGWEMIGKTSGPGWDVDQTDNPSFAIRQIGFPPLWYAWERWLPFVIGRAA